MHIGRQANTFTKCAIVDAMWTLPAIHKHPNYFVYSLEKRLLQRLKVFFWINHFCISNFRGYKLKPITNRKLKKKKDSREKKIKGGDTVYEVIL